MKTIYRSTLVQGVCYFLLIGGLLAQGLDSQRAATLGTCLHGWAGDQAAQRRGQRGLIATDLFDFIAEAVA